MKIELISFTVAGKHSKTKQTDSRGNIPKDRWKQINHILESTYADLLLFPGWSLHKNDVKKLNLQSVRCTGIIEIFDPGQEGFDCHTYCQIVPGKLRNLQTSQWFSEASHIENDDEFISVFIDEIEEKRIISANDHNLLLLSCGEINILRNIQKEENRVAFRSENKDLADRFFQLMESVSIILNPIHTPMGVQGKMKKRREYFSEDNRLYCSTSNLEVIDLQETALSKKLRNRKLQYCCHDSMEVAGEVLEVTSDYVRRLFKIDFEN